MGRQELKEKVNDAYDRYLDKIDDLAVTFGIVPGSVRQVEADPRTRLAASKDWHDFLHEQDVLNQEYAASHGG